MKKYLNTPFYYSEQVETLQIKTLVDNWGNKTILSWLQIAESEEQDETEAPNELEEHQMIPEAGNDEVGDRSAQDTVGSDVQWCRSLIVLFKCIKGCWYRQMNTHEMMNKNSRSNIISETVQ